MSYIKYVSIYILKVNTHNFINLIKNVNFLSIIEDKLLLL